MKFLCFTLLLLLLPLLSVAHVTDFNQCPQFFANNVPPTVLVDQNNPNRYQQICQCLLGQNNRPVYFYATLYDTVNKIPVYSAYEFGGHAKVKRKARWRIEPQLDGGQQLCMGGLNTIVPVANGGQHQALNADYPHADYDKGHLYPVYHTRTHDAMLATFTLTNAAPQDLGFNRGFWKDHEDCVSCFMEEVCTNRTAFVVTGVVPDIKQIGNGVRVAKLYWRAFCCQTVVGPHNIGPVYSAGYIGPDNNGRVQRDSVQNLTARLSIHYNMPFQIFPPVCNV